jgi:hypothetical protein
MRKRIGIGMCALAAAALGCESSTGPIEQAAGEDAAIEQIAASAGVVDEERPGRRGPGPLFDRLAGEIRGFGGFYFDGCDLVVVLTDRSSADQAADVLAPLLRRYLAAAGRRCPDGGSIRIQAGVFTWQELSRYRVALRPVAATRGVGRIAISIPENRILVQVISRRLVEHVTALAARLGVPVEALQFVVRGGGRG